MTAADPRLRLEALIATLDARSQRLERRSSGISRIRLVLVLAGLGAALFVGQTMDDATGWLIALATLVVFLVIARFHERVESARKRTVLLRTLYARHVARIDLDWAGLIEDKSPVPPDHPFASDLDILGTRSLLGLMSTAGTRGGHDRLRDWLLTIDPDADLVRVRQRQARALVPMRRLRDRLALLAHEASGGAQARWDDADLRGWLGAAPPTGALQTWAWILGGLSVLTAGLFVASRFGLDNWWIVSLIVYLGVYAWRYVSVSGAFDGAHDLQRTLAQAVPLLLWMERAPQSRHPDLAPLWAPFQGDTRPSVDLRSLRRIAGAAAFTRNDVGRIVLNLLLPYDLLLALALARLRGRLAGRLGDWLDALYQVEALSSLAAFADLRPGASSFPDLRDSGDQVFVAVDVRHPLLPMPHAVGNDVILERGGVLLLTGSNMSGKSTFMRSVGLASVMAWAGGPVMAERVQATPLRPVASMRIGDALTEGLSTFYAEVRRLRLLLDSVDVQNDAPALVLIDEMLRGTNNRERLAGAQAITRHLTGANAVSLVATHDLALTELAEESTAIRNAHFREETEGDHLIFDYRLRDGPCPTTNALVIMRRAGLPVPNVPE